MIFDNLFERILLTYIKNAVTRNYSEKSINSILDYISSAKEMELLQNFYELTLDSLKHAKNERLWFKTNSKLASLYLHNQDWPRLQNVLRQLKQVNGPQADRRPFKTYPQIKNLVMFAGKRGRRFEKGHPAA